VAAGEEERRQIAATIHDDSIQVMTAAGMRLQILRKSLDSPEQLRRLDELEQTIHLSIARLRRLIFELRPPALDHEGLGAALRMYVGEAIAETGAAYDLEDVSTLEPSEETRVILYRIAQEVLANVRRHAGAEHVRITISDRAGGHLVEIVDDGVGFRPEELGGRSSGGLAAVRGRAELAGGRLEVVSAPGAGTTVECWLPAGGPTTEDAELVA
jgi:signal transduction histidine kinase